MSNTQAQFGFQHIGYVPGYAPDMAPSRRMIQSTYATAIFFGDPVCKSSASPYVRLASDASVNPLGTSSATACAGIFQGCYYIPLGQSAPSFAPWFPGSVQKDATALIIDAPGALFRVAAILTAVPATAIGNNIGWTAGPGGTSIGTTFGSGFSSFCVDQSTMGSSSAGAFVIVDMWSNKVGSTGNGVDNANNFNWVVVGYNSEWLKAGQTGVA